MNESNPSLNTPREVIQRYCPKRGENVVMLRTVGEDRRIQCLQYDACDHPKDPSCGRDRG